MVAAYEQAFRYTCGREGLSARARDVIAVTPARVATGRLWGYRFEEGDRIIWGFMGFEDMTPVFEWLAIVGAPGPYRE